MKPLPKPTTLKRLRRRKTLTKTEQGGRTESKEDDLTVNIHNLQKLGTEQLESNTTAASFDANDARKSGL
jgi:hypothetical protein